MAMGEEVKTLIIYKKYIIIVFNVEKSITSC